MGKKHVVTVICKKPWCVSILSDLLACDTWQLKKNQAKCNRGHPIKYITKTSEKTIFLPGMIRKVCINCGKARDYHVDANFCIQCGQPALELNKRRR